jgi:hypothetical protein
MILHTAPFQPGVQRIQIANLRQRHPVVAPEVAAFALHTALLVASRRITELAQKPPVRTEGDEPTGLFPARSAQHLLHRTLQVVVAQDAEDAPKISERMLVRFQKSLLRGMRVSPVESSAAGHRPHLEDLQLHPLAAEDRPGFIPVHLRFGTPGITLRNEYLVYFQSQLQSPPVHITAHRSLARTEPRQLAPQPLENPMGCVPLLRRRFPVRDQDGIDERRRRFQLP